MPAPTSPPTTTPQQTPLPLPPLTTLITPQQIHHLFHTNQPRAARWHLIFTQLHHAALHPHPNDATKQQRAHQKLASLSRIVETVREKKRAGKRAEKEKEGEKETAAAAALLLQHQQRKQSTSTAAAAAASSQQGVQNAPEAGEVDFVRLDGLPAERQACTMCKKGYSVQDVDGEVGFRNYPVQLSCSHLVCFGCAKVLLRMLVNCASCGASFGDGRAELARIERQIELVGVEIAKGACFEAGYGGSSCEAEASESDAMVSDVDGDGVEFTREDVEGALTLLNLAGKRFGMEDIDAGLALLKLRAGTDVTLEDYLLTILRQ